MHGVEGDQEEPSTANRTLCLVNAQVRARAVDAVRSAPEGWRVIIKPPGRSLDQNALFHAVCGVAEKRAMFMGRKLTRQQWKVLFISGHTIATGGSSEIVPGLEGEFVNIRESTATMSKSRQSSLIDYAQAWLANQGVDI